MDSRFLFASDAIRQRHKPHRLPESIGLNVLRAPAAKQPTPVSRPIKHRLQQRRGNELPPPRGHDVHLMNDPHVVALEVPVDAHATITCPARIFCSIQLVRMNPTCLLWSF
jgi:hypothetical protein